MKTQPTVKKEEVKKPLTSFRSGTVKATVWENMQKAKDGKTDITVYSVNINKSYKDKDGEWQDTNSYFKNDLPKLKNVVDRAFEFLYSNEDEEKE